MIVISGTIDGRLKPTGGFASVSRSTECVAAGRFLRVRDEAGKPVPLAEITKGRPSQLPEALSMEAKEAVVTPGEAISAGSDKLREEKLHALKKWKDTGLITDEDYDKEKAKILQPPQPL